MISTAFITRWQQFWSRPAAVARNPAQTRQHTLPLSTAISAPLTLRVTPPTTQTPHTVISPHGVLDRRTSESLLHCAAELYAQGCRRLLLDLRGVTRIELAGRFALHNIDRLYRGESLLDPEEGWQVLHDAVQSHPDAPTTPVRLLASPALTTVLQQADLGRGLGVYQDLMTAVAA